MNNKNTELVSGVAKMRPKARLISLLGDELISDERVSVVELVKNAYDADAENVTVKFELDDRQDASRLIIEDDGHGMNLTTVLGAWFEPGTDLKNRNQRSPHKSRLYQGAKGVGRFAAARLGTHLFLETKKKKDQGVFVALEWGNFDDESYLDEIDVAYETIPETEFEHGTKLVIEGVGKKKEWLNDDFENLHIRLSRLISPFKEIDDFKILLDIPNFPELTGEVEPHPLSQKPKYLLSGSITEQGLMNAALLVDKKVHKEFTNHNLAAEGESVTCGQFEFEIRAWDRDRTGMSPYMLEYNMNISDVRRTLDTYCGVSIYRDGFRVHPYGEQGDDWLSLDTRSRLNPTKNLANNQIISSIKISRETNAELRDRTTREGLVHTQEFDALKEWFKNILSVLEEERYRLRPREDAKPEYTTTLFEAFDMSDVVIEADKQLGKTHPVSKLVKEKDVVIRDGVKKLQDHYSRVLMAAGLGQLVDLVIHEIGAPLGRINREIPHIQKILGTYELSGDDGESIEKGFTSILSWLEQISNLRSRLDPKTAGKRGRATSFDVEEEVLGNLNLYENLLNKQKISVSLKKPKEPVIVNMSRSNLGQVVANLLDNAIHWLTRHHGDGGGGKINIEIASISGGFKLSFSDNGPGINEEDKSLIFDQYYSKKTHGMGLGLFIARQVIEPYGSLVLLDEGALDGANFEAKFIRKVGL